LEKEVFSGQIFLEWRIHEREREREQEPCQVGDFWGNILRFLQDSCHWIKLAWLGGICQAAGKLKMTGLEL